MKKPIYKIKESKDNKLETVFEKSDFTIELTMGDYKKAKDGYDNKVKELEAQKGLEEAKMNNVKRNHPEVLEVDEQKRVAITVYTSAEMKVKEFNKVLDKMAGHYKEMEAEMKDIEKQIGLTIKDA